MSHLGDKVKQKHQGPPFPTLCTPTSGHQEWGEAQRGREGGREGQDGDGWTGEGEKGR